MLPTRYIILADNQSLTQAGFIHLLGERLWHAVSNRQLLTACLMKAPAAGVILDYTLFDFQSMESLLLLVRRFPKAAWLFVAEDFSPDFLRLFSPEPSVSFLPKDSDATETHNALTALLKGESYIPDAVREQLATHRYSAESHTLTETEREIVRLLATGKTAREIAALRHSSVHTIVTHKKNIFRKLGISTNFEALRYALRAGIVNPVEYYI